MYKVETNDGEELESAFLSEPYVLHEGLTGFGWYNSLAKIKHPHCFFSF